MSRLALTLGTLFLVPVAAACTTGVSGTGDGAIVQPGAPGQPSRPAGRMAPPIRAAHTQADVAFMQGMIHHHMQAMAMTALVPERAASDAVRALSGRIEASQTAEIAQMKRWLTARKERAEMPSHDSSHMHMPGLLTPEQMAALARATGSAFDRLFLESMIMHHEGAVTMVATLFATDGAGQEPELFHLASHVDADQRAEIARMRALLNVRTNAPNH